MPKEAKISAIGTASTTICSARVPCRALRAQGVVHGAPFRHVQIAIELDRFLAGGNRGIDDGQPAGLDERAQPLAGGGAMRRICLDADDAEALREIKRRVLAA